jgi:hypothetical protein
MDGPNSINGARGSPDTIPRNDQADAFMANIANAKANQNRGPEANQLPQARPAELRSYTPSLRERIAWGIQDGLMALGVKAYEAGHLGRGLTDIMSLTPLGIPLAANDAGRAMQRRDWGGVLVSSLGMLPAAKPLSAAERLAAANARNLGARQIEQMVPREGQDLAAQLDATSLTAPGTLGASRVWSIKARLSAAQLPTSGRIRFVPERGYDPNVPLPRGPNRGYLDRFGNEWIKGGSRTSGQLFEWDVQLSRTGRSQLGWATRDGAHLNVSLDGKVTH